MADAVLSRQLTSIESTLPIVTPTMVVGNDSYRASVGAAVTGATALNNGEIEFTVEAVHNDVTNPAFEAQPRITVTIDGSTVFQEDVTNHGATTLHKSRTLTFTTALDDGEHEICVEMEAPGYNPQYN